MKTITLIYLSICIIGIASCNNWDRAIYSASVVERAICVWSLLHHMMEHPEYMMYYPVQDLAMLGSLPEVWRCQLPQKRVST